MLGISEVRNPEEYSGYDTLNRRKSFPLKDKPAAGSTCEDDNADMSAIIAEDSKVVEHFVKLLRKRRAQ